jgi:predicted mannosyl-3-phosphoglycerate phosphatase (HAD superfamily)
MKNIKILWHVKKGMAQVYFGDRQIDLPAVSVYDLAALIDSLKIEGLQSVQVFVPLADHVSWLRG